MLHSKWLKLQNKLLKNKIHKKKIYFYSSIEEDKGLIIRLPKSHSAFDFINDGTAEFTKLVNGKNYLVLIQEMLIKNGHLNTLRHFYKNKPNQIMADSDDNLYLKKYFDLEYESSKKELLKLFEKLIEKESVLTDLVFASHFLFSDKQTLSFLLKRIEEKASSIHSSIAYYHLAYIYHVLLFDPQKSFKFLSKAEKYACDPFEYLKVAEGYISFFNNHKKGKDFLLLAEKSSTSYLDLIIVAHFWLKVFYDLKGANRCLKKIEAAFKDDDKASVFQLLDLAEAYYLIGDKKKSLRLLYSAFNICQDTDDYAYVALAYKEIHNLISGAHRCLEHALQVAEHSYHFFKLADRYKLILGDSKNSKKYYLKAKQLEEQEIRDCW